MRNIIANQQDQTHRFFTIDQLPESIQSKLMPAAQILNLQTIDIQELKRLTALGIPDESGRIREYVWKIILGFLPKDRKKWQTQLDSQQKIYQSFVSQSINQDKYKQAPLTFVKDDPRWRLYEDDYGMWEQIEKDTCRTQAQLSFFSSVSVPFPVPFFTNTRREKCKLIRGMEQLSGLTRKQEQVTYNYDYMTRILFIFARLNPKVGYVQGMNELLAPIFYLVNSGQGHLAPIQEAACFFMFNNLMSDILQMHIKDYGKKENPVHSRMRYINTMLLALEPQTWQKLDQLKIEPFYYCFRWITLMFSQEFELFDTLRVWESIISCEDRKGYTNFLALSLLLSSVEAIAVSDYSQIMGYLKNINQTVRIQTIIKSADRLYQKYGKNDLSDLAEKNFKKLNQSRNKGLFRFLKKLF